MSAVTVYDEALERLGRGDRVAALEEMKRRAVALVLNPSGGDISFAVALPRIAGRTVQLTQAVSENPPGTPAADLTERPVIAQRQLVGHYIRLDPLYTVRYAYA